MKILAKNGLTLGFRYCIGSNSYQAKTKVQFVEQRHDITQYSFSVSNILMEDNFSLDRYKYFVYPEISSRLLTDKQQREFHQMSLSYANKIYENTKRPIVTGGFTGSYKATWSEKDFKETLNKFEGTSLPRLCKDPSMIVLNRYISAQERQASDWFRDNPITNEKARGVFRHFSNEYGIPTTQLFMDLFGGTVDWKIELPSAKVGRFESKVISFGVDPYPYVVFTGVRHTLHAAAKIDGKLYVRQMGVSPNSPESQLEMAVMLIMTDALAEDNKAVSAEAS